MVHKSNYRGVHSGNTLRAFNSRYSRRYHNQACIISRVNPQLLSKLIGKAEADTPRNFAVDVALSLNKQARWLLPSSLKKQIVGNDLANPDLAVTLLERHKLKRHANCVSFHSNTGETKRIQPRNGRYFSFAFPAPDGKSRRELRRERRELLASSSGYSSRLDGLDRTGLSGTTGEGLPEPEMTEDVRYEVFYPCSVRSSISHNPKYIKQNVSLEDGDHVVHGKLRKRHQGKQRKRMTLKEVEDWEYPALDSGDLIDLVEDTDNLHISKVKGGGRPNNNFLSSLIDRAEETQHHSLAVSTKPQRKVKTRTQSKYFCNQTDNKSHIIYLDDVNAEENESTQKLHNDI